MAGEAKTQNFLLSTATVMIGPQADLFDLNPAAHSLGLVKNFQCTAEPTYQELTQGVKNTIVFSVATNNPVRAQMEVYEYTSKNLSYGLGLDVAGLNTSPPSTTLKDPIAAAASTAVIAAVSDTSAQWPVGKWIAIQPAAGAEADKLHVAKIVSAVYNSGDAEITITYTGYEIPTGVTYLAGDKIFLVDDITIGSKDEQPFFSSKVVGLLPAGNKAVTILFPKIRITKGFTLGFQTDNFGNLPFEFTPYEQVSTDAHYAAIPSGVAKLLV